MSHKIGVLALQGAFAKHIEMFRRLGADVCEVREPDDLRGVTALAVPGGESTAISKMLVRWELVEPLTTRIKDGMPILGTCAGLILLADRVEEWDNLPRFGGLDVTVRRNAYGRQIDSFEAPLELDIPDTGRPFPGVFIRAPRILPEGMGAGVQVLAKQGRDPVLVRQDSIVAATFHPELTRDDRLHHYFLKSVVGAL